MASVHIAEAVYVSPIFVTDRTITPSACQAGCHRDARPFFVDSNSHGIKVLGQHPWLLTSGVEVQILLVPMAEAKNDGRGVGVIPGKVQVPLVPLICSGSWRVALRQPWELEYVGSIPTPLTEIDGKASQLEMATVPKTVERKP